MFAIWQLWKSKPWFWEQSKRSLQIQKHAQTRPERWTPKWENEERHPQSSVFFSVSFNFTSYVLLRRIQISHFARSLNPPPSPLCLAASSTQPDQWPRTDPTTTTTISSRWFWSETPASANPICSLDSRGMSSASSLNPRLGLNSPLAA